MSGAGRSALTGRWGEALAAEYLRKRGCAIVAAGYRTRYGEIDLIAEDSAYLMVVEVKLRRGDSFSAGREAVDRHKQQRLRITAELYLAGHPTEKQPRFDVAEIYAPQGLETRSPAITYIENAF